MAATDSFTAAVEREIRLLHRADLYRSLRRVDHRDGATVRVNGRSAIDFSSNDYLGLAGHPDVAVAIKAAVDADAAGAAASRSLAGNHPLHEEVEIALARMKGVEASLLFTSGYAANVGAIPALAGRRDVIYSDSLNHASILDGCRLSRAEVRTFPHVDIAGLARLLQEDAGRYRRRLIVVEGVYSMDGDLCPLDRLVPLAQEFDAWIYLDDAHGTGVLGATGGGTAEHWNLQDDVAITVGTLGKALGVCGAFVAGPGVLREFLLNRARSFLFTTASPSALAAGVLAALRVAAAEPWRRDRLWANVTQLRHGLAELGHEVPAGIPGHIVPVILGEARATMEVAGRLLERGLLVGGIRPPTVRLGGSRLRITVSAAHTDEQIAALLDALADVLPRPSRSRV
jgi:8-amino-7-oxononanoate synthase